MYTIKNSLNEIEFDGLNVSKLIHLNDYEVLCISLEKGSNFPTHTSPKDAHLLVLEGKVNFHINQEVYTLSEKQLFDFPKLVEHSVDALENSTFLIIR